MEEHMSEERRRAVKAMRAMGWAAVRVKPSNHPSWEFTRAGTGGLWDVVRCTQSELSMLWVANAALKSGDAPELADRIAALKKHWLAARFPANFMNVPL
jgi:hypothetical protein